MIYKYKKMKKIRIIIFSLIIFFGLSANFALADNNSTDPSINSSKTAEAQVLKVLDQKVSIRENGSKAVQQNLQIGILTGPLKGQTEVYTGISGIDVVSSNVYKVNDKVLVSYNRDETGAYVFYVTDYVRTNSILWLTIFFILVVMVIGGKKGFMA